MNPPAFYESDRALSEYLLFHYGSAEQVLPWSFGPSTALDFPARCVSHCLDIGRLPARPRALDLGCAVGRSSFELARHCPEVLGIDFSSRFIQTAKELRERGSVPYQYVEEGELTVGATAIVPRDLDRARVQFEQGDALALRPNLGQFDVVLMANLIDRVSKPRHCLETLPNLVRRGGQLILTSPCTWLEDYTPRPHWLGGYAQNGAPVRTLETLKTIFQPAFLLVQTLDLPFLIREHARKFQWSVALATVWIRQQTRPAER